LLDAKGDPANSLVPFCVIGNEAGFFPKIQVRSFLILGGGAVSQCHVAKSAVGGSCSIVSGQKP
jgi:hypothetical protein